MSKRRERRGRTPLIDQAKIEAAVRRVARREPLGMRGVADELGVDVSTLYRHVGGVDALRQIAATLAAPSVKAWPKPEGESWQSWLRALAGAYRNALRDHPDLIDFAHTALDPDYERLEQATRILVGFGFETRAAGFAHGFIINTVVGYVHQERREEDLLDAGRPAAARFAQAVATDRGGARLSSLRSLDLGPKDFDADAAFERFLTYAIDGIAAQPGAPA